MTSFSKKNIKSKEAKFPSELRLDVVSGDWVVIATGRAKKPEMFKSERRQWIEETPQEKCPFCRIESQEKPLLIFSQGKKIPINKKIAKSWTTVVIPNKYPVFIQNKNLGAEMESPYQTINAIGYHELVVTRNHQKSMGQFDIGQIKEIIDVYQERYRDLMEKPSVRYVSIFHNHGSEAGASQPHPHSQIAAIPLIDADLRNSLANSQKYFENYQECIYCRMNDLETKSKKRVVFENKDFLVICPFASKSAFEIIISPKKHLSYFEKITEKEK